MPVYNGENYLREAIDSILNQTFKDLDLLILNDGSTDNSVSIVHSYTDSRIRLISNERNLGIVETLNRGIELARGEYIGRMDADDISHPTRIEDQVRFMDAHRAIGISGTNVRTFGTPDATIWMYPPDPDTIRSNLIFSPSLAHPSVIMRKNILSENDLRYSGSFPHAEDYEFWIRCSRHTSFSNVNKILLSYRLHPTKVGIRHKEVQEDSINRARESLLAELNVSPSREEKLLHNNLGNWNFQDSEGFLLDTQKWLLKLKEANMNAKVFPEPAFSYVLFEKWFSVCYRTRSSGMVRWRIFLISPLSRFHTFGYTAIKHFIIKHLVLILDMLKGKSYR